MELQKYYTGKFENQPYHQVWSAHFSVTSIIANSPTINRAIDLILEIMGEKFGWDVGEYWKLNDETDKLEFDRCWTSEFIDKRKLEEFNTDFSFSIGAGTPGLAWAQRQPIWTSDITDDACFKRKTLMAELGLCASVAFPILADESVIGVMLFFSKTNREHDEVLRRMLSDAGHQIGQFVKRKRSEDAVRELNQQLDLFAKITAHDLQNPLQGVIANYILLQMQGQSSLDEEQKTLISSGLKQAYSMSDFITRILQYCYAEKEGLERDWIDLGDVIDNVRSNLQLDIEKTNAKIVVSTLPVVYMNKACLIHIFQNLIGNAIKYQGDASPIINITAERENGSWKFSIKDNGIGISKQDLPHVVKPFYHKESLKNSSHGIGLATCKKIIDSQKGSLKIYSTLNEGTQIDVYLPASIPTPLNSQH